MPNRLTITLLAGALAIAGLPAFAQDLPDSGSKNFSPPDNTPSYFSNETEPVSARTADATARDWSAVDTLIPASDGRAHASHRIGGRHGRYALMHAPGRHGGEAGGLARAAYFAKGVSNSHFRNVSATSPGTAGVKHGRLGTRHMSAAAVHRGT